MKKNAKHVVVIVAGWLGFMASSESAPPDAASVALRDTQDSSFLREDLRSVIEQVASYRGGLKAMATDDKLGPRAKAAEAKIDALLSRSERLALNNRLSEALSVANEANRLIVDTIVRLRSGETVVVSLTFDSPMEEYAYEQLRFKSNEMMVVMNIDEGRAADPLKRKLVEDYVSEGRHLRVQAEKSAQIGKYPEAVSSMEAASGKLIKAMQSMGVPVF